MTDNNSIFSKNMELTHILVVKDVELSKRFYVDKLGAELFREYGGTSCVIKFLNNWILLVTGGPPTPDKPDVTFIHPQDFQNVNHSFTIRVEDCMKTYSLLKERGVEFLTEPYDWEFEIRAFFRDPDGHLYEISEYKGS